jgi:hypothetical protein
MYRGVTAAALEEQSAVIFVEPRLSDVYVYGAPVVDAGVFFCTGCGCGGDEQHWDAAFGSMRLTRGSLFSLSWHLFLRKIGQGRGFHHV